MEEASAKTQMAKIRGFEKQKKGKRGQVLYA
jgi:hypothetical protein